MLEDGITLRVANIVWCTGFGLDFSWVRLPIFGGDGYPLHQRGRVVEEPGLYFVGLPFQHSLSSTLIGGVGRDPALVAEWIAKRIRRQSFTAAQTLGGIGENRRDPVWGNDRSRHNQYDHRA